MYRLHGASTAEPKAAADAEFAVMHDAIRAEMLNRSQNLSDLWTTRAMLKRTFVACGVQIFGQFTGINGMHSVSVMAVEEGYMSLICFV